MFAADDPASPIVAASPALEWRRLPDLPDPLGVAGPFVGVHRDAVLVAGGANFPDPVWEQSKVWHDDIHVLTAGPDGPRWITAGRLPRASGYGASVSTPHGVVCIGGNDASTTFPEVLLLTWDPAMQQVSVRSWPSLPSPCVYAQAALIGEVIYLVAGQTDAALDTATNRLWTLDLSARDRPQDFHWKDRGESPWPSRAFHLVVSQHRDGEDRLYVLSGRRQHGADVEFLTDVWEFTPSTQAWRQCRDIPRCVAAGTGIAWRDNHLLILSGDDGRLFHRTEELRDQHPGFPRDLWTYRVTDDTWHPAGQSPRNQVTTTVVRWGDGILLPSGEVRPRVRTPSVWQITPKTYSE